MTDINGMIGNTKSDIIMLAEYLYQCKDEIDHQQLTELVSNMEAFVEKMKKEYGIKL